jgi:hypothetical protein
MIAPTPSTPFADPNDNPANNVMRHAMRALTAEETQQMRAIKTKGLEFYELLVSIGDSRDISIAKTHIEEAVMWGVRHVTGEKT